MKESGYYPAGAEFDPNAPYNEPYCPDEEVEVVISLTLSKAVKVKVNDYSFDEEGLQDFSECDLKRAVSEQVLLPHKVWDMAQTEIRDNRLKLTGDQQMWLKDLEGWDVDDFEVNLE